MTIFVSAPPARSGLANRIKCLISTWYLAKNNPTALYWQKSDQFPTSFHDLFNNEIPNANTIQCEYLGRIGLGYRRINTWKLVKTRDDIYTRSDLDFTYNQTKREIIESFLPLFQQLKPNAPKLKDVPKHGMHIRTWQHDNIRQELFNPKDVYRILDNNQHIFVCCDNEKFTHHLKMKYPGIILSKATRSRSSKQGIKDALTDMILLSTCKHIYVSYASTFPEVAWWIGGASATVKFIQSKKVRDQKKEYTR